MIDLLNRNSAGNCFELIVGFKHLAGIGVDGHLEQFARRSPRLKRLVGSNLERVLNPLKRANLGGHVRLSVKNAKSRYQKGYLVSGDHPAILTKKSPSTPEPGDGLVIACNSEGRSPSIAHASPDDEGIVHAGDKS